MFAIAKPVHSTEEKVCPGCSSSSRDILPLIAETEEPPWPVLTEGRVMSSVATRENDRDAHHVPRKCFPGTIKTMEQHVIWVGMSLETRVATGEEEGGERVARSSDEERWKKLIWQVLMVQ